MHGWQSAEPKRHRGAAQPNLKIIIHVQHPRLGNADSNNRHPIQGHRGGPVFRAGLISLPGPAFRAYPQGRAVLTPHPAGVSGEGN